MEKYCKLCGKPIPTSRTSGNVKYCSEHCQRRAGLTLDVREKIVERGRRKSKRHPDFLFAYESKCAVCGWSIPTWRPFYAKHEPAGGCHVHHIVSVCDGGTEDASNLILLCPNCHKMAHVGLLEKDELLRLAKTNEQITEASEKRRLKVAAEYLLDDMY